MTTKTITITEDAYGTLKNLKEKNESFSEAILRMGGRKSLREFIGILSENSARQFENSIKKFRKRQTESHQKRIENILRRTNGTA